MECEPCIIAGDEIPLGVNFHDTTMEVRGSTSMIQPPTGYAQRHLKFYNKICLLRRQV